LKALALDNDWEAEYTLTRKNATTGVFEPATGLSGLVVRISLTDGGVAIHTDLSIPIAERGATGIYFGVLDGDKLRTHLASLLGTIVYEVMGDGTNVLRSSPRKVIWPPRP
jgi:hypothetical protein